MCCKLYEKFCCMLVTAVLIGGAVYVLSGLKCTCTGKEGALHKEMRDRKERLKNACSSMKEQTKDMADDLKSAAETIRDDVKGMKDAAGSVFEGGENA